MGIFADTQNQQNQEGGVFKQAQASKTQGSKLGQFAKGAAKGLVQTLLGSSFATVGVTGLNKPAGELPSVKEKLEAKTPIEKAGKVTEQVAEALIPLGGVAKGFSKIGSKGTLDLLKSTEDILTRTERQAALDEGRAIVDRLGKTEYLPTDTEIRASGILNGKLKSNQVKNIPIIKKEISTRGKEAEKYLEANAKPVTPKEQADMFKAQREKMARYSSKPELKAYDEQMTMFTKLIPGRGGFNTANFYKALKEYETNVASKLAKGKEALLDPTGAASAKLQAAKDIRKVVRDMIGNKNVEFKDKMFDLASLYDVLENVIIKGEKVKGTAVGRFLSKPIIKYGVGSVATFEGVRRLLSD